MALTSLAFLLGCHATSQQPGSSLPLGATTIATAPVVLAQELCLKNIGDTGAVLAVAKASAWPATDRVSVAGWKQHGVPIPYSGIWEVAVRDSSVTVAVGKLGQDNPTWFCEVIWAGKIEPSMPDQLAKLHLENVAFGPAALQQNNVPDASAENLVFVANREPANTWAVINFSRPAPPNAEGPMRISINAAANN